MNEVVAWIVFGGGLTTLTVLARFIHKTMRFKTAVLKIITALVHGDMLQRYDAIERKGYMTPAEYYILYDFLIKPYIDLGGNGINERLIAELSRIPLKREAT